MKFSQGIGKRPIKTILQVEAMDTDLKNRIWNLILEEFFDLLDDQGYQNSQTQKKTSLQIYLERMFW